MWHFTFSISFNVILTTKYIWKMANLCVQNSDWWKLRIYFKLMLQTRSLIRRSVDQWESERKTSAWKLLKQKSNFHNNRIPSKWSDFRQIICHIFFREISVILPVFDWLLSFSSATDCFWSEIGRGPILIIHWRAMALQSK